VIFVRGASGLAARPVLDRLQNAALDVIEITCAKEPGIAGINDLITQLRGQKSDVVVACGGGSVIDTGKALAFCLAHGLRLSDDFSDIPPDLLAKPGPLPLVVLPTTAGTGAEVTSNAVLDVASKRAKLSLRGRALFAQVALVDPVLMLSAPPHVVLNAGLDALTQIIEAYTSVAATPFSDALTSTNVARGLAALRAVTERPDVAGMTDMAWVSLASGLALANSGLGAAHGLASVVGGGYAAPHGALCGRFLIPVLRQNLAQAERGSDAHHRLMTCHHAIATAFAPLDPDDLLSGLDGWISVQALPRLAAYGMKDSDFEGLAQQVVVASSSKKNAVRLDKPHFIHILQAAL